MPRLAQEATDFREMLDVALRAVRAPGEGTVEQNYRIATLAWLAGETPNTPLSGLQVEPTWHEVSEEWLRAAKMITDQKLIEWSASSEEVTEMLRSAQATRTVLAWALGLD
jgi:hypothetical protein